MGYIVPWQYEQQDEPVEGGERRVVMTHMGHMQTAYGTARCTWELHMVDGYLRCRWVYIGRVYLWQSSTYDNR